MATYIPGIESYIPDYTPFQPDFKLTSMLMEKRQDRYDTNHKQLSDLYGSVVYADLSREDTREQRDYFAQQLTSQIKKISGTDLSLQQNVDAASGVFKPFLENKLIQEDIYRTNLYRSEMNKAQFFAQSSDPNQNDKFNELNLQALQFQMEDFVNASPEEAVNLARPEYVPSANLYKEALAYLQESGIEASDFTFTKDNKFIITQKNGALIEDVAFDRVRRAISKNPRIQRSYATQSYAKARMFAQKGVEAGKYATLNEGKTAWAESIISDINNKAALAEALLKGDVTKAKKLAQTHQEYIKSKGEDIAAPAEFQTMLQAKREAEEAEEKLNEVRDVIQISSGELTSDQEATLSKAYSMLMNWSMGDDLRAAAKSYSMQGASREIKINGYQRDIESHKLAMIKQKDQQAFTSKQNELNRKARIKAAEIKAGKDGSALSNSLVDAAKKATGQKVPGLNYLTDANGNPNASADIVEATVNNIEKLDSKSDATEVELLLNYHQLKYNTGKGGNPSVITVGDKKEQKGFKLLEGTAIGKLLNVKAPAVPAEAGREITIDEARSYYSKPENKKELYAKLNNIKEIIKDEHKLRKEIPNIDQNIQAVQKLKTAVRQIKANDYIVGSAKKQFGKIAQENFDKALAFEKYSGVSQVKKDFENNIPKIVNNNKILPYEDFEKYIINAAQSGRTEKNFLKKPVTISKGGRRYILENGSYRTISSEEYDKLEEFDIDGVKEYAKEAYNNQMKVLNQTMNGSYNASDNNEDGSKTFDTFGFYDFIEGKPVSEMNDNSLLMTTTINAGTITPKSFTSIEEGTKEHTVTMSFLKQIADPNSVQYVPGIASKKNSDELNSEDSEKAERIVTDRISKILNGIDGGEEEKKAIFTLQYLPGNMGFKDSPDQKSAYIITIPNKAMDEYVATANEEAGAEVLSNTEKTKFSTITVLVDENLDQNPYAIDNMNISLVNGTIQDEGVYSTTVLNGGTFSIYKDAGNYKINGTVQVFDPNSPSYKKDVPVINDIFRYPNKESFGALANQPVRVNDVDRRAQLIEEKYKVMAKNLTEQIKEYEETLRNQKNNK